MTVAYTPEQIHHMRESIIWFWHPAGGKDTAMIEERLRTYIMAGVDPEELRAHLKKVDAAVNA